MATLTASFVKNETKNGKHSDHDNNLWLFIGKNGKTKTWKFKGRIKGVEYNKTIGYYPNMSLAEARKLATEIKATIKNGVNYFAELEKQKEKEVINALTFGEVAEAWYQAKVTEGKRENTLKTDRKRLDKHILPYIKDIPIIDVKKSMLIEICDRVKEHAPYSANRVAGMLQSIFEMAIISEHIETTPAYKLTKLYKKPPTKHNPYLEITEINKFLKTLEAGLLLNKMDVVTYRMILIQFHTLSRPNEVAKLKWEYIDFDRKEWTIPIEGMKNKQSHTQPLPQYVIDLLIDQKPFSEDSQYVFPASKRGTKQPHRNLETANNTIKRIGYKGVLTAHGMRGTASTALSKLGYHQELIDTALSHLIGSTVRRSYIHHKLEEDRKKMLSHWSEFLASGANTKGII